MVRTFVALELHSAAVKDAIAGVQRELMATGAQVKPVERDNLHMTLKFLGEVPDTSIDSIISSLREVDEPRFTMHFKGVGVFPNPSRINVVWLGAEEGSEQVKRLSRLVNERLASYGRPEDFRAHLTILRVKGGRNIEALAEAVERLKGFDAGTAEFIDFQLKKSVLTPTGPVYGDLSVFPMVR
jgi:2'-5' RNA ligase